MKYLVCLCFAIGLITDLAVFMAYYIKIKEPVSMNADRILRSDTHHIFPHSLCLSISHNKTLQEYRSPSEIQLDCLTRFVGSYAHICDRMLLA